MLTTWVQYAKCRDTDRPSLPYLCQVVDIGWTCIIQIDNPKHCTEKKTPSFWRYFSQWLHQKLWFVIPISYRVTSLTLWQSYFEINLRNLFISQFRQTYVLPTEIHVFIYPLQWRHNGPDSVSNHQPHDCFLNRLFRHRSKKTSKLRVTGLCAGNSPEAGEFPAQMASNAENVPIWWRHHAMCRRSFVAVPPVVLHIHVTEGILTSSQSSPPNNRHMELC